MSVASIVGLAMGLAVAPASYAAVLVIQFAAIEFDRRFAKYLWY